MMRFKNGENVINDFRKIGNMIVTPYLTRIILKSHFPTSQEVAFFIRMIDPQFMGSNYVS